jgi:hypothetical protein
MNETHSVNYQNKLNIKPTKIIYKSKEYDITNIISKVRHSILNT